MAVQLLLKPRALFEILSELLKKQNRRVKLEFNLDNGTLIDHCVHGRSQPKMLTLNLQCFGPYLTQFIKAVRQSIAIIRNVHVLSYAKLYLNLSLFSCENCSLFQI